MISPFAGRRLPSRPTAEAGPACSSARLPCALRSAQPSAASGLPSAAPRPFPRVASRPRQGATAAWRPCAVDARRAAATACVRSHAPTFICRSRCARHSILPRCLATPPARALLSRQRAPPQPRRSNSPPVLHHGQQSSVPSSASLYGTWCSRL